MFKPTADLDVCFSIGGGDPRNDRQDPDKRGRCEEKAQRHSLRAADR